MIRNALDAVANGVPKPEESGGVKLGLCIDKEVFKSILMKNQMSGEYSCIGRGVPLFNLGALSHSYLLLYPPSFHTHRFQTLCRPKPSVSVHAHET